MPEPSQDWTVHIRPRLATLQLSPAREAEIVEELSQHLDERFEELRAGGATETDARRLAIAELLEPDALADRMRFLRQAHVQPPVTTGMPRGSLAGDLWRDVRYGVRMLQKQPGFAAAAILTLALGIGANTTIFTLVNATLFRRLPAADRDRLAYVHRGSVGGPFSYPLYRAIRDGTHTLEGLAAWGAITAGLNAGESSDLVHGLIVTGNFFDVLGIGAAHGRLLSPSDDVVPGGHPVAVIGHELWQSRFAGRLDVLGKAIRLNGHVFTIVGVAPAEFRGPQLGSPRDLYVPMMMQAIVRPPRGSYAGEQNPDLLADRRSWLSGLGRLAPGITLEQARAELGALATMHERTFDPADAPENVTLVPVDDGDPRVRQPLRAAALLLGGVVASVLLIACANIANLLLARTASRRRELAVRLAVGASRGRLVRQLLTESVLLSLAGGVAGAALAWVALRALGAAPLPPEVSARPLDLAIDGRVLVFSLVLSLLTGILFGLFPALKASRPGLAPALKDAAGGDARGRRVSLQSTLVVVEVALSMLLLVPAGLFVRSLQAARAIDPGIDVEQLVAAPLNINLLRYTSTRGREFYREVIERIERLPGVESAAVARVPVIGGQGRVAGLMVEGRPEYSDEVVRGEGTGVVTSDRALMNLNVIGPGFFDTVGVPLLLGRDFTEQDVDGRPPVVIVNEAAARVHFDGGNPLGKRVSFRGRQGPWREIVGVVRDHKYSGLREGTVPIAYMPLAQNHETGMTLYVRTAVPPASLIPSIRREIQAMEPNLPVPAIQTMSNAVAGSLFDARLGASLLAAFGGLALLLASVGIYGVLSFSVSRRTREMGIRLALGAETRSVFLLVVRDGMLLAAVGIVLGLAGGLAGARSLASFLYGVSTADVPTFAGMTLVLAAVALAACVIPARRAMRVNPLAALRSE